MLKDILCSQISISIWKSLNVSHICDRVIGANSKRIFPDVGLYSNTGSHELGRRKWLTEGASA